MGTNFARFPRVANGGGRQYQFARQAPPSSPTPGQIIAAQNTHDRITPGFLGASMGGQGVTPQRQWDAMFPKGGGDPGSDIHSPAVQSALDDAAKGNATITPNASAVPVATSVGPGTVQRANGTGNTLTSPYGNGFPRQATPAESVGGEPRMPSVTTSTGVVRAPAWQQQVVAANEKIGQPGTEENKAYVKAYNDATNAHGAGNFDPVALAHQTIASLDAARNPNPDAGSPEMNPKDEAKFAMQASQQKAAANSDPNQIFKDGSFGANLTSGKTLHDVADALGFTPQAVDRAVDSLASAVDPGTDRQQAAAAQPSALPSGGQLPPKSGKAMAAQIFKPGPGQTSTTGMDITDLNKRVADATAAAKANPSQYAPANPPVDPKNYVYPPPGPTGTDAAAKPAATPGAPAGAAGTSGTSAADSAGAASKYDPESYHAGHADGVAGRPPQVPPPASASANASGDPKDPSGETDNDDDSDGSDSARTPTVSDYTKSLPGATDASDSAPTSAQGSNAPDTATPAPAAPPPPPAASASAAGGSGSGSSSDDDED